MFDFFLCELYNMVNFKEVFMLPGPIFEIFGQGVFMYGICIAVGLLVCLIVFYSYTKRAGMPAEVQDFIFFVLIGGLAVGFLAAMLFQGFYNWLDGWYPGKPFNAFGSGLTVMGGLIGGASAFLILYFTIGHFYFKRDKKDLHIKHFNTLIRVAPVCISVAHAFGRIGCLMSGCCHGAYLGDEYVFGGIYMKGTTDGWGYYVPTQLYESLFLFALFAVLSILYFKRCNITMSIYLIAYGVWRIIIEIFRTDARGAIVLGMYPSQWQSIVFITGGIALLYIYVIKKWKFFLPEANPQTSEKKRKSAASKK